MGCEWQGGHDLWPAAGGFCVCAGAHEQRANNWQNVGQRVGSATSVVHACLVPSRDVTVAMSICAATKLELSVTSPNWDRSIWHELTITEIEVTKLRKLGEMMDFHFDFWVRNKAPVHLILSQNAFL